MSFVAPTSAPALRARVSTFRAAASCLSAASVRPCSRRVSPSLGRKRAARARRASAPSLSGFAGGEFENTECECQLDKDIRPIFVDKIQIQQVIFNLVRNGMEAIGEATEGHLVIVTKKTSDNFIEVLVRDNGPGLDEEMAGRLFQSFATTKPNGMGVGLSICRSIIEDHAGRLWETRNQDGGMTFHFTLPIVLKDSDNGE